MVPGVAGKDSDEVRGRPIGTGPLMELRRWLRRGGKFGRQEEDGPLFVCPRGGGEGGSGLSGENPASNGGGEGGRLDAEVRGWTYPNEPHEAEGGEEETGSGRGVKRSPQICEG